MRIQETNRILKEAKVLQHDVSARAARGGMFRRLTRDARVRRIAKMVAWRVGAGMATGILAAVVRGVTNRQKKKHPLRFLKLARAFR